jgi:hypothetical protein
MVRIRKGRGPLFSSKCRERLHLILGDQGGSVKQDKPRSEIRKEPFRPLPSIFQNREESLEK